MTGLTINLNVRSAHFRYVQHRLDMFFENMGRSECVLDEVMSKCVVEAKAGPRGPNQVIVVK
jgi:hypothetical protein